MMAAMDPKTIETTTDTTKIRQAAHAWRLLGFELRVALGKADAGRAYFRYANQLDDLANDIDSRKES